MSYAWLAVGGGAAVGAWLRWWLGNSFNQGFHGFPLGTLAANLLGGFLIGVAVEYFTVHQHLAPELRLAVITGFLGGLTTFSTFSAEAVSLLTRAQYGWALAMIASHLLGSIVLTLVGIGAAKWLIHS